MSDPTYARARNIYTYAKRNGVDWVQLLDTYGVLLTDTQIQRLRVETLRALKQSFDRWRPHEYTRRLRDTDAFTADDMHRAIGGYLDEYLTHVVEHERLP